MLKERYLDNVKNLLLPQTNYLPYPKFSDRDMWQSLNESVKQDWVTRGEEFLAYPWLPLSATDFLAYTRDGNVVRYENKLRERRVVLATLVLAECIEGRGRFLDMIINGIWSICEETTWIIPSHMVLSKASAKLSLPDVTDVFIDLCAGETANVLATTYYLLKESFDEVSTSICARIQHEVNRRILDPYLERTDLWWMGMDPNRKMNNWNPWVNSNVLLCFLLLEEDEEKRIKGITKMITSLDRFINDSERDGGCEEGPVYWHRAAGSLFDCLELLYEASGGQINLYNEPLIQELGRYLYRVHIDENYYINFADGSAMLEIESDLVYRYGVRIGDQRLVSLARSAFSLNAKPLSGWLTMHRVLPALFQVGDKLKDDASAPYIKDVWLNEIEVMAAREQEGSRCGLYLAAKGGHNAESHNHNDLGHFMVYSDGIPYLIDVGVETYSAKTFSKDRYDIWTMQSAYHNVPMVNGIQQLPGNNFKASDVHYNTTPDSARFSLNIASAYPESSGIVSWKRTFTFLRQKDAQILIEEDFQLNCATDDIKLHFITPWDPQIEEKGTIVLKSTEDGQVQMDYDKSLLAASKEEIVVSDPKLQAVWGPTLYRITLKSKLPVSKSKWGLTITNTDSKTTKL
ncbi:heparinase [Paenibacillus sp. LMG 31458]|uniref:Heparinase n=1 Tax=Paenibacillus phytorum TaxID=2654977 RepID=A0ABX1Y6D2_9BACL|nr:heparinase II/III family protein [Paenibacillus phytorum]NOU76014.1 heparinase [Paenibacillus phytorum]